MIARKNSRVVTIDRERLRKMTLYLKYITFCLEREVKMTSEQPTDTKANPIVERMMKWFDYSHLPPQLQAVSKPFGELAELVCLQCESGPERTVALRKLLEGKDAAVRAKLNPGC